MCFAALVATSFCFILRAFSIDAWGVEFGLSETQKGVLAGVGLWPFAISIVLLSLIIDRIGFKATLWFAAACHLVGLVIILQAHGYWALYWGTFVLSLGNGAVEAGINPLIAAQFRHDKTTWLNRLHAGWPAGFVLGGLLAMMLPGDMGWRAKMALILIPVVTYVVLLFPRSFPRSERVAAGVSYREMLAEAGFVSAFVVAALMVYAIAEWFDLSNVVKWVIIAALTVGYGLWSRAAGRPLFIVMILVMIPLAITELGTDSWITSILTPAMTDLGVNAGWVLVYAMAIVLVLRLFAGPLVHRFSPLGLLAISALVAAAGPACCSRNPRARWQSSWRPPCTASARRSSGRRRWASCPNSRRAVAPSRSTWWPASACWAPASSAARSSGRCSTDRWSAASRTTTRSSTRRCRSSLRPSASASSASTPRSIPRSARRRPPRKRPCSTPSTTRRGAMRCAPLRCCPCIMFVVYLGLILYFRSRGGYKPVVLDIKS